MIFSCIIPAKDPNDRKLQDLLLSIDVQDFPQEEIETIIVTDGDSESAKAEGIRRATGEILVMLCADNYFPNPHTFKLVHSIMKNMPGLAGVYSKYYYYDPDDISLNRYFALIGANDVVPFYLGKADRRPQWEREKHVKIELMDFDNEVPSLGCNGFFVRREVFKQANLDHYYPMDACEDIRRLGYSSYARISGTDTWHRTSDTLWGFLKKRFKYADDLYMKRNDRRWVMVEKEDLPRLALFVLFSLTFIQPLLVSIWGYIHIKDRAWFWHPVVCFAFTLMYGVLCLKQALLFRLTGAKTPLKSV